MHTPYICILPIYACPTYACPHMYLPPYVLVPIYVHYTNKMIFPLIASIVSSAVGLIFIAFVFDILFNARNDWTYWRNGVYLILGVCGTILSEYFDTSTIWRIGLIISTWIFIILSAFIELCKFKLLS